MNNYNLATIYMFIIIIKLVKKTMYILPSDLFNKFVYKVRNLCCVRELLALNLYFLISKTF